MNQHAFLRDCAHASINDHDILESVFCYIIYYIYAYVNQPKRFLKKIPYIYCTHTKNPLTSLKITQALT